MLSRPGERDNKLTAINWPTDKLRKDNENLIYWA